MSRYECLQAETSVTFNFSYIRKITKIRYCSFSLELNCGQRDFPIFSILSFQKKNNFRILVFLLHLKEIPEVLKLYCSAGKSCTFLISFKYAALPDRSKNKSTET